MHSIHFVELFVLNSDRQFQCKVGEKLNFEYLEEAFAKKNGDIKFILLS